MRLNKYRIFAAVGNTAVLCLPEIFFQSHQRLRLVDCIISERG